MTAWRFEGAELPKSRKFRIAPVTGQAYLAGAGGAGVAAGAAAAGAGAAEPAAGADGGEEAAAAWACAPGLIQQA
jgi:hypothetical protein